MLIPTLNDQLEDLGPIDPWLDGRPHVTRLASHVTTLAAGRLPAEPAILVFEPSPAVEPWGEDFLGARDLMTKARAAVKADERESALVRMREALELMPGAILYSAILARQLAAADKQDEAIHVLERALAGAGEDDWGTTAYVRAQLARLYQEAGRTALADRQYRLVLANTQQTALRQQAEEFFAAKEPRAP